MASSIFSYEQSPLLLPQLAAAAKSGLEQSPKSFKSLQQLAKYFQIPASDFDDTPLLAVFQHHPGSLGRLTTLSNRYIEKLVPVEAALSPPDKDVLKPLMQELCSLHTAYRDQFITEYQQTNPYEPFTILNRYPKTIKVYLTAFFEHLKTLSPEQNASWKEAITESSPAFLSLFSRMAILRVLEMPNASLPELFKEEEMTPLRTAYQTLKPEEKAALRISLCHEPDTDLAQNIARLAYSIQLGAARRGFNGVLRFVYEEASKSFSLLDQMHPKKFPRSFELQFRTVFLAQLKQENLEHLPIDFMSKELKKMVLGTIREYRAAKPNEKDEFEKLYLEGNDDSDTPAVYDLLQNCKKIFSHWASSFSIPIHLLAQSCRSL